MGVSELAANLAGLQLQHGEHAPEAAAAQFQAAQGGQEAAAGDVEAAMQQPFPSGTRPCKFVPREAHDAFAYAATKRIEAVLAAVEAGALPSAIEEAVHELLVLPSLVLVEPNSSRVQPRHAARARARPGRC